MASIFTTPVLTPLLRSLARGWLWTVGWKVDVPEQPRPPFVFIGAPHTSNWDLVYMMAAMLVLKLDIHWIGKHTLFRFPCGGLMRWLGGIPVDRTRSNNLVATTVQAFISNPRLILCVQPEGTRSKVQCWRTGFYHIAHRAGVPILLTVIDAENKSMRILGEYRPTGDIERELPEIQHYYRGFRGLRPENAFELPEAADSDKSRSAP
jgi:1-acyl-sn-glycerol-3-phosphate acyltransferase